MNNSLPLGPPNGIHGNYMQNRTSVDNPRMASPPPVGQITRSGSKIEKNRLSLAFLKRSSFFGGSGGGTGTRQTDSDAGYVRPDSPTKLAPPPPHTHNNLAKTTSTNSEGRTFLDSAGSSQDEDDHPVASGYNSAGKMSYSTERDRDAEAQYLPRSAGPASGFDASEAASSVGPLRQISGTSSAMNKFGSVKKRLSSLNLGRKGSRASVRDGSGRPQMVVEE